jgi:hypothetical protein
MIAISTTTASTTGSVVFKEKAGSILYDKSARVSRTATLDGGAYISYLGFSDGDRTLRIKAKLSEAQDAALNTIFESYTRVFIAIKDGIYSGAIAKLTGQPGNKNITLLIQEKET